LWADSPQTVAQTAQRDSMSACVAFAKTLVGPVFNAYTDKFQKSMSGFNRFIKDNILEFDGDVDYSALVLTSGTLFSNAITNAGYNAGTGVVIIQWEEDIGNNGDLTDKVFAAAYDKVTGDWAFPVAEVTRDDELIQCTLPIGLTATNIQCWMWSIRKSGNIVLLISNSAYLQVTE